MEAKLTCYKIEACNSWLFSNLIQLTENTTLLKLFPGEGKEQYSVDLALRRDMFKDNKGALAFSINDVFNTNRFGTIYTTETFTRIRIAAGTSGVLG